MSDVPEPQPNPAETLTPAELADFRRLAGIMVPASAPFKVPAADDSAIFADIVRSLGRDTVNVREALKRLREASGAAFTSLDADRAVAIATAVLETKGPVMTALGRAVLQCYYRDDRVIRSLGLDPRPPFPKGHPIEQGDWSLLDPVRTRPRMWRDVDSQENGQKAGKGA